MIAGVLTRGALRDQRRALLSGEVQACCPTCGYVSAHHLYGRREPDGSLALLAEPVAGDGAEGMARFADSGDWLQGELDEPF